MIGHHHTLARRREKRWRNRKENPSETIHCFAPHIGCTTRKRTSIYASNAVTKCSVLPPQVRST